MPSSQLERVPECKEKLSQKNRASQLELQKPEEHSISRFRVPCLLSRGVISSHSLHSKTQLQTAQKFKSHLHNLAHIPTDSRSKPSAEQAPIRQSQLRRHPSSALRFRNSSPPSSPLQLPAIVPKIRMCIPLFCSRVPRHSSSGDNPAPSSRNLAPTTKKACAACASSFQSLKTVSVLT